MIDLFFGGLAAWFTIPAFIGSFFFLVRMALMFVGGDGDVDSDFDVGAHGDLHADGHVGDHTDSSSAFKVLSVQTIAAFLMGFGWGGLGGLRGAGWDITSSTVFGFLTGAGMVWLLGKLLGVVYRFQSSGTMRIDAALGVEGSVYIAIPPHREGRGRVRLVIDNRERFYNAVTDHEFIESHARVRVTEINDDNTITVMRA